MSSHLNGIVVAKIEHALEEAYIALEAAEKVWQDLHTDNQYAALSGGEWAQEDEQPAYTIMAAADAKVDKLKMELASAQACLGTAIHEENARGACWL